MTVFYRKYRPQRFAEIIGQDHIVKILLGQLKEGKVSHGYLFAGPKGTGKTSCARILAKAVNCQRLASSKLASSSKKLNTKRLGPHQPQAERTASSAYPLDAKFSEPCNKCTSCLSITDGSHLDLIEIDGASNRNIEDIRDLREKIKLAPISARFKVYIIDEVHMLTLYAFNALLKTLEEPPAHAIFILCTTEAGKLPLTIISRVQRFNFGRATDHSLERSIKKIASVEGIKIAPDSTAAIVKAADGSFRDAVSLLDQLAGGGKIVQAEDVARIALSSNWEQVFKFIDNLADAKMKEAVGTIEKIYGQGADMAHFAKEVMLFLEKLLFMKIGVDLGTLELEGDQVEKMRVLEKKFTISGLGDLMKLFLVSEGEIKLYPLPQIPLVLAVCKYCLATVGQNLKTNLASGTTKTVSQGERDVNSPAKTPPPAKDAPVGHKSLVKIKKYWGQFLDKVRPVNTQVTAILRSAQPLHFDGSALTLEVFYRFHKEKLEEPKIASMLDSLMQEVMGTSIRLKFVLSRKEAVLPKEISASDVIDVAQEDLERVAAEIFSK